MMQLSWTLTGKTYFQMQNTAEYSGKKYGRKTTDWVKRSDYRKVSMILNFVVYEKVEFCAYSIVNP